jgi:hypothetical protein
MIQRRGLASQWTAINPVLEIGEFGFEEDTQKFKVGDGETTWNNLPYFINEDLLPDISAGIAGLTELIQTSVSTAVSTAVAGLVDSAPAALDTLNELAAAVADDATFANTITNALANKADATHSHTLDGLSDVSVSSATTGQFLKKNSDGSWGPGTVTAVVSYTDLTNVPSTFPPSTHTHAYSSLTGIPSTFAPSAHTHAASEILTTVKDDANTSYSMIASDAGKMIRLTSGSAITFTVQDVLSNNGDSVVVLQDGTGQITFSGGANTNLAGAGTDAGALKTRTRYSIATIVRVAANQYRIFGDLAMV